MTLNNVKKGDELTRKMPAIKKGQFYYNNAIVIEITENTIICDVYVDVPREMAFDKKTGVDVEGERYGMLIID